MMVPVDLRSSRAPAALLSGSLGDRRETLIRGELQLDPARFAVNGNGDAVRPYGLIAEGAFDRDHRGTPFQLLDAGRFLPPRDT
jgi:hypothetical protein